MKDISNSNQQANPMTVTLFDKVGLLCHKVSAALSAKPSAADLTGVLDAPFAIT
jgi:hypothetical protein